jgi:hypothetical protein
MKKRVIKPRLLKKKVWCVDCRQKRPPTIKAAVFLIPARSKHYDLLPDKSGVDNRVVGICNKCLEGRNDFQKSNTEPVDVYHEHLIYSNI